MIIDAQKQKIISRYLYTSAAFQWLHLSKISTMDLNITSDYVIINIINTKCNSIALLLENPSVEVQLATYIKSPKVAACFKSPCEELKVLLLFT